MSEYKNIQPKFPIKSLKIKNYKGIKSISFDNLPSEAKWIFFTGENGYGKTTILQAIAEAIYHRELYDGSYVESLEIHLLKIIQENFGKQYLCGYGSSRLNMASENSIKEKSPIKSLFESTLLQNIEYSISRWYFKQDDPEFKKKYDSATELIKKLLHVSKIEVDRKKDTIWYYGLDKTGSEYKRLTSDHLAAGYRNLLAMIGDLILRLFEGQPNVHNPKDLTGIVIVDELELHLHPKWQKRLPSLLSEIFPRIQFIASTHSPIPLLGAPEHSVFIRVDRNAEDGITVTRLEEMEQSISNLLPNSILTSPIFGMSEIFPINHDSEEGIKTQDFYGAIKVDQLVKDRVEEYMTPEKEKELLDFLKSEEEDDSQQ